MRDAGALAAGAPFRTRAPSAWVVTPSLLVPLPQHAALRREHLEEEGDVAAAAPALRPCYGDPATGAPCTPVEHVSAADVDAIFSFDAALAVAASLEQFPVPRRDAYVGPGGCAGGGWAAS